MKVLDLQCAHRHSFEGWFASEDDFQSQLARGLVECPMCGDKAVHKMLSAPRLNLGAQQAPVQPADAPAAVPAPADGAAAAAVMPASVDSAGQAAFLAALRHVMAHTEDVGKRFAEEARRMHYGDARQRSIRGQASARETAELLEEGIDVMPLPLPLALKETLQ